MFTNNLIAGAAGNQGGFYDFPIEQSLKFNDNDSSYLSWTPASAGNRKTWTWSGWIKRGVWNANSDPIFTARSGLNFTQLIFGDGGTDIYLNQWNGSPSWSVRSNRLFRDVSAWYHIVVAFDSTQATSTNRIKFYVNGEQITSFSSASYPSLNQDSFINSTTTHYIGSYQSGGSEFFDGYMAEVNFVDGQALDPTSFGETKSGVWIPKDPSGLTYGTNGFRLSFQNDTVSEGFNTVLYDGTGADHSINGLGFSPDFVWIKSRTSGSRWHALFDSVRGTEKRLFSNATDAESTTADTLTSFDADGFTLGSQNGQNASGDNFVAWCWDAGSGSPVSNTDGSITSTVKANTAYGFSVITYTGNGTNGATVGHGLSSAPDLWITKNRSSGTADWLIKTSSMASNEWLRFKTDALLTTLTGNSANSSVITTGGNTVDNASGNNYVTYAFHSVTGYSSIGSYTGNGSTSGPKITTGFRPAFLMVKKTDSAENWFMIDNTRYTSTDEDGGNIPRLLPNTADAESTDASIAGDFLDDGFQIKATQNMINTNGGNYIYIAFADTRDNAFWKDQSGNGNDWQPNNLTYQDSLPDSTTNNFCTFNSAIRPYPNSDVLSEGNLRRTNSATGVTGSNWGTFNVTSGKWYYEVAIEAAGALTCWIGWSNDETYAGRGTYAAAARDKAYMYMSNGNKSLDSATGTAYGATYTAGDVIGVALDADNNTLTFYKNGVSQGVAFTGISTVGSWIPAVSSDPGWIPVVNFGQDSSFAGNKPAQGNTDANGVGDFYHSVPSGYLALAASNLPNPTIDPAQDDVPTDYFGTVLYSGDGTTPRSITGLNFQPDFNWIKSRNAANHHQVSDAVRGATNVIYTSLTNAEAVKPEGLQSFDTNGFTVGNNGDYNQSGRTYVAWNWLAGNGTSSNTDGSISSTISVNQKAGFSIVSWSGNTTSGATVGHGLGVTPSVIIFKRRDGVSGWHMYHHKISSPETYLVNLNDTAVPASSTQYLNSTLPNSSVITLGNSAGTNGSSMIAYCFAEVEGFSKFGFHSGSGSTDGTFIYTGFAPAFVMQLKTNGGSNRRIWDDVRVAYNPMDKNLIANDVDAEISGSDYAMDLLSNGFKHRSTNPAISDASGGQYIYFAWASMPFKYSNAR